MIIILFGPPGSGKGTQAAKISSLMSFKTLSTGDLLRSEIAAGTPLGKEIRNDVESGKLVDDETVIKLVNKAIEGRKNTNFILDGFPRTLEQAKKINAVLNQLGQQIACVIELQVDQNELVKRIVNRFSCKNCGANYNKLFKLPEKEGVCDVCGGEEFITRADDNEEVIVKRFKEYQELTTPILPYYKEQGILFEVNADLDASDIFREIAKILKNVLT